MEVKNKCLSFPKGIYCVIGESSKPVFPNYFYGIDGILNFAAIKRTDMFWTLELISHLEEAPWPATKDELIDYALRTGAPIEVVENLQELEVEENETYEGIEDLWPDYPTNSDFFFQEDEY